MPYPFHRPSITALTVAMLVASCGGEVVGVVRPVCRPQGPLGAACTSSVECELHHYCDDVTSTCRPLRSTGEPCTALNECGSGRCIEGVCRDALGEGEICTDSTECASSLRCEGGTCKVAFTLPAEPCDARKPCIGSVCEEGLCVGACASGAECVSTYCQGGVCTPKCACDMP